MRTTPPKLRKLKVPAISQDVEVLHLNPIDPEAETILELAGNITRAAHCSIRYRRHMLWLHEVTLTSEAFDRLAAEAAADTDAAALALTPQEFLGFRITRWRGSTPRLTGDAPRMKYWTLVHVYAYYKRERANCAGNRDEARRLVEVYRQIRARYEPEIELDRRDSRGLVVH